MVVVLFCRRRRKPQICADCYSSSNLFYTPRQTKSITLKSNLMPVQHSKFLEAYEAAPSRPRDNELAQFSQIASSCYIGLKSVVPDLLVKSARLKAPRRASIDINAPASDDFLLNRSGRTYEVVPSLVFVRPSSANNVVRNRVAAAHKAAADAAEAAVTRRFFQRADLQALPGMRVDGVSAALRVAVAHPGDSNIILTTPASLPDSSTES